jgi:hypothetical protein
VTLRLPPRGEIVHRHGQLEFADVLLRRASKLNAGEVGRFRGGR